MHTDCTPEMGVMALQFHHYINFIIAFVSPTLCKIYILQKYIYMYVYICLYIFIAYVIQQKQPQKQNIVKIGIY